MSNTTKIASAVAGASIVTAAVVGAAYTTPVVPDKTEKPPIVSVSEKPKSFTPGSIRVNIFGNEFDLVLNKKGEITKSTEVE